MKNKNEKNLLAKEFELLVKELKDSGLEVNENSQKETSRESIFVTFISKKKNVHDK